VNPNSQITVKIVLYGRIPYFQTDRTCTVLYGIVRYGTVNTVKKAEVRRIPTSLTYFRFRPTLHSVCTSVAEKMNVCIKPALLNMLYTSNTYMCVCGVWL
jgi:hypothetical protein